MLAKPLCGFILKVAALQFFVEGLSGLLLKLSFQVAEPSSYLRVKKVQKYANLSFYFFAARLLLCFLSNSGVI